MSNKLKYSMLMDIQVSYTGQNQIYYSSLILADIQAVSHRLGHTWMRYHSSVMVF